MKSYAEEVKRNFDVMGIVDEMFDYDFERNLCNAI